MIHEQTRGNWVLHEAGQSRRENDNMLPTQADSTPSYDRPANDSELRLFISKRNWMRSWRWAKRGAKKKILLTGDDGQVYYNRPAKSARGAQEAKIISKVSLKGHFGTNQSAAFFCKAYLWQRSQSFNICSKELSKTALPLLKEKL